GRAVPARGPRGREHGDAPRSQLAATGQIARDGSLRCADERGRGRIRGRFREAAATRRRRTAPDGGTAARRPRQEGNPMTDIKDAPAKAGEGSTPDMSTVPVKHMKWWGWGNEGTGFHWEDKPGFAPFVLKAVGL